MFYIKLHVRKRKQFFLKNSYIKYENIVFFNIIYYDVLRKL